MGDTIFANRKEAGQWEAFKLSKIDSNTISLINYRGDYVSCEIPNNGICIANRKSIGGWERFSVIKLKDGTSLIKNSNNEFLFVDSLSNKVFAKASSVDSAYRFTIIKKKP